MAEMYGWNKDDDEREASKKGFASMSQDSADKLDGAIAVMTSHANSNNEGVNTARLEAIEKALESIRMVIDTLNTKGITLKR